MTVVAMATEVKGSSEAPIASAVMLPAKAVHSPAVHSAAVRSPAAHAVYGDENEGKGLGIAMFVLLLVGFLCNFILPAGSLVCVIAAMILASILTCGCCCASEYDLKPNVKQFATATLVSLCLMFIVQLVGIVAAVSAISDEVSDNGKLSDRTAVRATSALLSVWLAGLVLNITAIVFSAIFTWGRGCGNMQRTDPAVV